MATGLMAEAPPEPFVTDPDRGRMRRDRMARLHDGMAAADLDALILLGYTNVAYATGLIWPVADAGRAGFEQPVAVVLADDDQPHLFSPVRQDEQVRSELPADHLLGPVFLDVDEGVHRFVAELADLVPPGADLALDEWTHAMARETSLLFADGPPADAGRIISGAKLLKTPDEVAFMREGLRITEEAIRDVQAALVPGARQVDLTAAFLRRVFEAGADANVLDPIWQVMPRRIADGPWTTTGDLACPLLTTERELEAGDVLWSDVGLSYQGLHTDFGRTWVVGGEPDARQRSQFERWKEILAAVLAVTRAGATNAELTAAAIAANGGERPWMPHFYLGHGLGVDSAEMPFVGSDIGQAFDEQYVLKAGTVLVVEPVVWDDGAAGYRSEEVLLITDDGWLPLTDYPYDPF